MHPIERLRAVARARDVEQTLLASEAASVLGSLAFEPMSLLTSCRRLIDRHPAAGALWWTCARLLAAADARAEARTIALELDDDPARIDLSLELPEGATVAVIPDAAGGSDLAHDLAGMREDLEVVGADRADAWSGRTVQGVLLVETGAAGPERFLGAPGMGQAMAEAREAGAAVWLLVAVGRRLPGPLFDALVGRLGGAAGEVVPIDAVDRVIEPRQVPCPCPPELLHTPPGR
ncbi:MAG: hypothetical protein ACRD0V_00010 [Acidimicrobiales bacterium]